MDRSKTLEKVKCALYRAADAAPKKLGKATWIVYGAVALTTTLTFADGGTHPKIPLYLGD